MDEIEVVAAIYRALDERDFDSLLALLDPEVVVTQDPALPWGGRFVGHDGFGRFGQMLTGTIDSSVAIDALFMAEGDVYQVGRTRGVVRSTGTPFDVPEVHRWTIRNGRAVQAHFAIDTDTMLTALAIGTAI
jgi:ketosteroid isomerase-like protein